eukprot:2118101-Prymnesium_polylepis.1
MAGKQVDDTTYPGHCWRARDPLTRNHLVCGRGLAPGAATHGGSVCGRGEGSGDWGSRAAKECGVDPACAYGWGRLLACVRARGVRVYVCTCLHAHVRGGDLLSATRPRSAGGVLRDGGGGADGAHRAAQ